MGLVGFFSCQRVRVRTDEKFLYNFFKGKEEISLQNCSTSLTDQTDRKFRGMAILCE